MDLILPISKHKTVLSLLWKNPEARMPKWFRELDFNLKGKKIFLDIGSNIGFFSAFFLKRGGEKAYLFEINPSINDLLRKASLDYAGQINVCGYGLSETNSEKEFYSDTPFSLMSSLDAKRYADKKNFKKRGIIKVYSLDAVANSLLENEKISLIKIDVEGLEDKVLIGAQETLKKQYPPIIFEANRTGDFEKCEKILKLIGYKFRQLDETNWLATHSKKG